MKKVATYRPPEPCKDCGGLHFGSARCPYLERTGPCEICDTDTVYACSDCAIDFKGRVVRVCTNPNFADLSFAPRKTQTANDPKQEASEVPE